MGNFIIALNPFLACPVCVGNPDHAATLGMNMAIAFMVLVVGGVLGCLLTFIAHLARKAKCAAREEDTQALLSGHEAADAFVSDTTKK